MRLFVWLLRAFLFFALFAFALNNRQVVTVHWFFGVDWNAPMVIVVLVAFAAGSALGVLAMVPAWWTQRRKSPRTPDAGKPAAAATAGPASVPPLEHPPRDGL